jgi:hypothetical protein
MKIASSHEWEVDFYQFNSVRRQFHGGRRAVRPVPYRLTVLGTVTRHSRARRRLKNYRLSLQYYTLVQSLL